MHLRPWPRVLALTGRVYSYTGRRSMLKQPDGAFEIPLYFFYTDCNSQMFLVLLFGFFCCVYLFGFLNLAIRMSY